MRRHSTESTQAEVENQYTLVWETLERLFSKSSAYGSRVQIDSSIQDGLQLASLIVKLVAELTRSKLAMGDLSEKEASLYDQTVERAKNLATDLRDIFSVASLGKYVYYLEQEMKPHDRVQINVAMTPLNVAAFLKETLFDKRTVICTSATLATTGTSDEPDFEYFKSRVGEDHSDTIERILPPVFDYEHNALLYIPPRSFPEAAYGQNQAAYEYEKAIAEEMLRLVLASRGRAFLLFSSKRMLDIVYSQIHTLIPYPVLRQGDKSRTKLAEDFKRTGNAVLFGLKTFWEGVDIAGDALSLVVIDKLPFTPRDDPIHNAHKAQLKSKGLAHYEVFQQYDIPQVVMQLKQGVGRLIRTSEDRGVMAILDVRPFTKGYGDKIIAALPKAKRAKNISEVQDFFREEN